MALELEFLPAVLYVDVYFESGKSHLQLGQFVILLLLVSLERVLLLPIIQLF